MTLLSTLKKIDRAQRSAARQHERESKRRHRELVAQEKQFAQMEAKAQAQYRVQRFHAHIELIQSMHKEASDPWDWHVIAAKPQPAPTTAREATARHELAAFKPGLTDKLFRRVEKRQETLQAKINGAIAADRHQSAAEQEEWAWFHRVANAINAGDLEAYTSVLEHLTPWEEAIELGAKIVYSTNEPWYLELIVTVADADIVPEKEPTITKTGKGSERNLAKGKRFGYYQDYVCSLLLRVAREAFAHLPIHAVFAHAERLGVDSATGRTEMQTLVSAAFDRPKFEGLVFERLDPSDAVESFTHHMKFKKTAGFSSVERLPVVEMMNS